MATCNYYPKFEANQVLTADQLNQVVCYLDKQERLTRSELIGVGIVCGFELNLVQSPTVAIKVSKGCGITSEGYLIVLDKYVTENSESDWHTFTKYRSYTDPSKYSFFGDSSSQLVLWELLYDNFEDDNSVIKKLSMKFLQDKAVILFLEKKEVDLATCTGDDCNEKGIHVEFNIRVLLIALSDLDIIIKQCSQTSVSKNYKSELEGKFNLPEYYIQREFNINSGNNFFTYNDFINLYGNIFTEPLKELPSLLEKTYDVFSPLLSKTIPDNPFKSINLIQSFEKFLKQNKFGFQYGFDFLKDIIVTYNEFRETIFDLTAVCLYDCACFPRHLMLGEAIPTGNCIPSIYRNTFNPSPIHDEQKELRKKTILLFERIVIMIQTFTLPQIKESEIIVTPSSDCVELGERAIPYYYYDKEFGINKVWNYDLIRKCKPFYTLSYYAKYYPENSSNSFIVSPLKYNSCKNNFYRIEGYLGSDSTAVLKTLLNLVNDYNLPISIIRLQLGKELTGEDTLPNCNFQDLDLLYQTLRIEFLCFLKDELKYFGQLDYGYSETVETKYGSLRVFTNQATTKAIVSDASIKLVSVKSYSETLGGVSNSRGQFLLQKVPVGTYTLTISATGYKTYNQQITITEDQTTTITISLQIEYKIKYPVKGILFGTTAEKTIAAEKTYTTEAPAATGTIPKTADVSATADAVTETGITMQGGLLMSKVVGYQYSEMSVGNLYQKFIDFSGKDLLGFIGTIKVGGFSTGDLVNKYYYPIQIVDAINNIISAVPADMTNFDLSFLSSKTDSLLEILDPFAEQINKNLKDPKYTKTGLESEILVHINDLGRMCSLKNFKEVTDAYKARALEVKKLTLFNNFIKIHPGIEHKAGVPKGGTFIIVCDENNIAVADFALPYNCCSNCPPINFVLADQPVIFKLSKTTFCANDDTNYVIINEPTGGVVTGPGVTQDEKTGQYSFNPSVAGAGQIKLNYNFNLHNYELQIEVIEITANFTYVLDKPQPGANIRTVKFAGLPDAADSYEWDFGDGSAVSTEQKPTHTFDVSKQQTFEVTLTVKKGECSGTVTHEISVPTCSAEFTYQVERVTDTVAVVQFDCLMTDADSYAWNFGDGQTFNAADPLHTFKISETNSFKVNLKVKKGDCSDTSEQVITIQPCTAEFTSKLVDKTINQAFYLFTAKTNDADNYSWDFGDGSTSGVSSSSIKHTYQLAKEEQKITVKLVMKKDVCTSTRTVEIVLPPAQPVTISLDTTRFCKKDEKSYKFTISVPGGKLTGPGVTQKDPDYFFTPVAKDVTSGTVTFTYTLPDGNSTNYSVVVYNPVAAFEIVSIKPSGITNQLSYTVQVKNGSQNADSYIWQLNGVIVSTEQNPSIVIPNTEPGAQYRLTLIITSKICRDSVTEVVTIPKTVIGGTDKIGIVTTGGSTTVFQPAKSGTVMNIQPSIAFNENAVSVKELASNKLFGNSLTANVAAYKNTKSFMSSVSAELENPTTKKLYINGNKNDDLANQFGELFDETLTRIQKYTGADVKEQRQFAYNLILLQTSQLFNLLNLQKNDIAAGSKIANLFTSFIKQLDFLKQAGITLNPQGQFNEILTSAAAASSAKPLLLTYIDKLNKAIVG